MSQQAAIRRFSLIYEKLEKKHKPSFDDIKDFLFDNGFEVSDRTIQRDFEKIRDEFGIEIMYNHGLNYYYIDKEKSINTERFVRFLEIANTANFISESLREGKETLNYISFDAQGELRGVNNLKHLLFAIKNFRTIAFKHENFNTGKISDYSARPYLLKEYQNRWYLVANVKKINEFRTFGIDRITDLKVKVKTFKPNPKKNPHKLFENIIGLNYSENKPDEVILSFTPIQGKYVKSLPFHKSQEILLDNDKELQIKLYIIPNYEFKQRILMLGENVKVLKPDYLIEDVKKLLKASLERYL